MRIFPTRTLRARALALAAAGTLVVGAVAACDAGTSGTSSGEASSSTVAIDNSGLGAEEVLAENLSSAETAALADATWEASEEVAITLEGDTATASGNGVTVDGTTVTITRPGTYRVSGTLDDGGLVVASPADGVVRLVLDGADITSSTGAAIDVQDADQVSVVLAGGSTNRLEDADTYADTTSDNAANAALYSTADLALSGDGALEVVGNANDGITGKDGLVIAAGDITVQAADDAVRGKDYLVVAGGVIDVEAGGDGLKSDADDDETAGYVALTGGEVTVEAGSDGVQGFTDVAVTGGTLTVTGSEEGIEAATVVQSGGDVDITSIDDGLNATVKEAETDTATGDATEDDATSGDGQVPEASGDGEMPAPPADGAAPQGGGGMRGDMAAEEGASLTVTGGTLHVDAQGDGLDSNGVTVISGGEIVVEGPSTSGNGALDSAGGTTVSGGTLLAVGSTGMAESPDDASTQGWVAATVDATLEPGTDIALTDADGTVVASWTLTKQAASVVYSGPGITDDAPYTLNADGVEVGTATAGVATAGGMGAGSGGRGPGAGGRVPSGTTTTDDDAA
ncbi:carbohydrate-binding domain-containing protein [Isoptericola sp. NEAU-Y5]|uniref:Carbohydrate-binding domain-containing protein n=1 Tax=Isoptericola luteus TaxID=2879484 RepID=A0ABS7ZGZ7_9MICO|nr:carbohydrate-binding domain-containing protein [Isoptericola sp. NEAU-Y5]MCA5894296.1 carbohydrate-binding domain-containing protein [Isoptericola sp. NEAU-Y5]